MLSMPGGEGIYLFQGPLFILCQLHTLFFNIDIISRRLLFGGRGLPQTPVSPCHTVFGGKHQPLHTPTPTTVEEPHDFSPAHRKRSQTFNWLWKYSVRSSFTCFA